METGDEQWEVLDRTANTNLKKYEEDKTTYSFALRGQLWVLSNPFAAKIESKVDLFGTFYKRGLNYQWSYRSPSEFKVFLDCLVRRRIDLAMIFEEFKSNWRTTEGVAWDVDDDVLLPSTIDRFVRALDRYFRGLVSSLDEVNMVTVARVTPLGRPGPIETCYGQSKYNSPPLDWLTEKFSRYVRVAVASSNSQLSIESHQIQWHLFEQMMTIDPRLLVFVDGPYVDLTTPRDKVSIGKTVHFWSTHPIASMVKLFMTFQRPWPHLETPSYAKDYRAIRADFRVLSGTWKNYQGILEGQLKFVVKKKNEGAACDSVFMLANYDKLPFLASMAKIVGPDVMNFSMNCPEPMMRLAFCFESDYALSPLLHVFIEALVESGCYRVRWEREDSLYVCVSPGQVEKIVTAMLKRDQTTEDDPIYGTFAMIENDPNDPETDPEVTPIWKRW